MRISDPSDPRLRAFRAALGGPLQVALDDADLYWLAGDGGARLTPDCRDSSVPLARALRLVEDGSDLGRLTAWARLANGDAYPLASGVILVEMARSSAGLRRESE